MSKNSSKKDFNKIYAEAVAEGLSILGEGTSLVTGHLERKYSVKLTDTAESPKILTEALDAAIDGGARVVQRRILRLIYEKMNIPLPSASFMTVDFEAKIAQARKDYEGPV